MTTLVLLTGLAVLSLNMFLPSLRQIAVGLEADYALVSLSIGGYLAVSSVLQIIMGPLSDLWGRRPVILIGLVMFTLASIGCLFADNIWVFLAFRVAQGGIVSGMVLSRAIVRDLHEPDEAARQLGIMGMAMALAPLLGPMIGGLLDQMFGWRANFVAYAVMGAVMLVIAWRDLGETNTQPSATFTAQFKTYPTLMRDRAFWAWTICLVFSIGGFYAFMGGAPLVGEGIYGLTPALVGVGMGSISSGFMLGNYLTGRYAGRIGRTRIVIIGRWFATLGPLAGALLLGLGLNHPVVLFGGAIFVGLGNGLTLPGANAGVMSVNPKLAGSASGLSGALTVAGGAVFASVTAAIVGGALGPIVLLIAMALTSGVGLLAALYLQRLEAQMPRA
ncbi:multidrug effflux MFS transporter [Aliiroseovarius subalbicans]|uniref:multidrug effflux MFS transporter n=1 Tax=Aliiroseovarius subalbicans TaxID=2925840 RepID=UPI001F56489A|nr:multidrug effflux MFS transporter [Aliiroseovarius subalbicans]MCI2398170.1 multidrug effflux MFS transporter [Aliiroseovarius subalbicans]